MAQVTIWGIGGFDPEKENNNIVDQYEVADPEPTEQELAKKSAMDKLRALGLSASEIEALLS